MNVAGPVLHIGDRAVPTFRLFALTGLAAAIGTAVLAGALAGVPAEHVAVNAIAGLVTCTGIVVLRVVATGRGDLVWSEHEAAVLGSTLATGAALGAGVRGMLDVTALGMAALLACGRLGCMTAGCCYGRPAERRGLRYGPAHVAEGLPAALKGRPLMPVQMLECCWAVLLLAGGCLLLGSSRAPVGATTVLVVGGRAAGRMLAERIRGDERRAVIGRRTPAQHWALGSAAMLLLATGLRFLPTGSWTVVAIVAVMLYCLPPDRHVDGRWSP
jgi:Prolipoprotein diacylglyceryl transferase